MASPGSLMVESREDFTPDPAVGFPLVVSAGHTSEHPLTFTQVSLLRVSLVNSYRVKPDALTRIFPRLVLCSWTLVAPTACAIGTPPRAIATADALTTPLRPTAKSM